MDNRNRSLTPLVITLALLSTTMASVVLYRSVAALPGEQVAFIAVSVLVIGALAIRWVMTRIHWYGIGALVALAGAAGVWSLIA